MHNMPYLYSGRAGPFGPPCHEQSVDKKAGKYFIFTGIFEPTEYDDHNI
jgi:hypothetical protein